MKQEEIKVGVKVNIPTTKGAGYDIDFFLKELREGAPDAKYLTIVDYTSSYVTCRVNLSPNRYYTYDFRKEDLTPYQELEAQQAGLIPREPTVQTTDSQSYILGMNRNEVPNNTIILSSEDFNKPEEEEEESNEFSPLNESDSVSIPETVQETEEFDFSNPPAGVTVLSMGSFLDKVEGKRNLIDFDPTNDSFAAQDLFPRNKAKGSDFDVDKPQVGLRYNTGKRDYTLMDMSAFDSMIDVLEYGAHKYSTFKDPNESAIVYKGSEVTKEDVKNLNLLLVTSGRDNWKLGGSNMSLLKLLSSLMRHLVAFMSGQDNDEESKLPHIGHMMCNLMFIGYHWNQHKKHKKAKKGTQFDDRFKS